MTKRMTISGIDGRADHGPDCKVDALGENCNCGIIPLKPQSSVPATEGAAPNSRWSDYAASEFGREEYAAWDAFYARMRAPILIEVFQQDWIPGFAAYYPSADYAAKPHVVLNIGSLMAAVDSGELLSKELPYMVAERLMHEVIHVLEHWANEEFSEEKVEGLIMKYRELAGRGESAEQEQNKAGGEGETLIISSSALDERPADLEISWCVGRPRPVTPQAEPPRQFCQRHLGCELPDNHDGECPQSGEKALEWYRNHQDDAQNAPQPQAEPGASEPRRCPVCLSDSRAHGNMRPCMDAWHTEQKPWGRNTPAAVPQASAGLSDEEIAGRYTESLCDDLECYFSDAKMTEGGGMDDETWDKIATALRKSYEAAIAEVRQRDGERIAEAHERAERAIEVLLRETRRAEAAESNCRSLAATLEKVRDSRWQGAIKADELRTLCAAALASLSPAPGTEASTGTDRKQGDGK